MIARMALQACVLLMALAGSAAAQPAVPEVSFAITPLFEGTCSRLTNQPPDTAGLRELRARLDEFRALWREGGTPLLRAAAEATGQPFRFRETIAAMHLCPAISNLSLPLTISMRRYLRTPPAGERAETPEFFNAIVFHELLHRHVMDLLGTEPRTPLWRKYAGESLATRWHLHLMAIEEAAFRRLGREREFAAMRAENQRYASYKRAREIVEAEGAEAFLAELR